MKKQFLLGAAMCALMSTSALAYDFEVGDFAFTITGDNTVELAKPDFPYEGDVVVPTTVTNNNKTYTVTGIGESVFYANTKVTSIQFPAQLKYIGRSAFQYTPGIKEFNLPQGIDSLGVDALCENNQVTKLVLPSSLRYISRRALQNFQFTTFTIPEGCEYLGDNCLQGWTKLETINLPSTLTYFGGGMFNLDTSLKTINVAPGCKILATENGVLYNADKTLLKATPGQFEGQLVVAEGCQVIGDYSSKDCKKITSLKLPNSLKLIQKAAFWGSSFETIEWGNGLDSIAGWAFYDCQNLKVLNLPETPSLRLDNKEGYIWGNNASLEEVNIPDCVRGMIGGSNVFAGDSKLKTITIGANVKGFGQNTFQNLTSLETITCKSTTPYVFQNAQGADVEPGFDATNFKNVKVYVPEDALEAYKKAPYWEDFDNIEAAAAPVVIVPPYLNDFSGDDAVKGWTNIDGNNDDDLWKIGIKDGVSYLWAPYNDDIPMDDWMITPAIQLEGGKTYKFSFDVRINNPNYAPEKLEVKMGNAATAEAMTTTILAPTEYSNAEWKTENFTLSPATSGLYYIGLHCITDADKTQLHITNFSIGAPENPAPQFDYAATVEVLTNKVNGVRDSWIEGVKVKITNTGKTAFTKLYRSWGIDEMTGSGNTWSKTLETPVEPGQSVEVDMWNMMCMNSLADGNYNCFFILKKVNDKALENPEEQRTGKFILTVGDGTGIGSIDAENAQATYYDLMGRKVQNPENGMFIKVQNGKASKVAL